MNSKLGSLIKKEFIQFSRDKVLVMLVIYVFMEIAICGWALFMDANNLPTAVYDQDRTQYSRDFIEKFTSSETFELAYYVDNYNQVDNLLDRGEAVITIVIPENFSANIVKGLPVKVQLLVDGSNSNTATLALGYAGEIIREFSKGIEVERMGITESQLKLFPTVTNLVTSWYSTDINFTHFNMIAMLAIAAFLIGQLLAAGAVVREKEAGTLEQLMVAPVKPYEIIIAKMLPMGIVKIVGVFVGVLIAVYGFGVPIRGSIILFFVLSTLLLFVAMGIGIFLATMSKNMQQVLLLCFFTLFPIMFLSGTIVPISNMPPALQWLSYLSPVRYYMDITLGIFLKGVGLEVLWPQALALAVIGLSIFIISSKNFQKKIS